MASKTNTTVNGHDYYRITRKVGMKRNKRGAWVADYRQFYGASKKEAIEKYEAFMRLSSIDAKMSLGEFAEWYTDNIFMVDSSVKDTTKALYLNAFHTVFDGSPVYGKALCEINGADVQSVISSTKRKASTVHAAAKMLRRIYKYLESQKIVADVTRSLVLPVVDRKRKNQTIETWTDEELKKFKENTPKEHRLRLLVILAMNTGARVGELLALTYDDIKDGQITINKALLEIEKIRSDEDSKTVVTIAETKTPESVRSVPVSDDVMAAVAQHKKWHNREMLKNGYRTRFVFTTETGSLYYKSSVRMAFSRLCKAVGVAPRGIHVFRHTFASRLAHGGVPITTVQKLLGHANISITSRYYIDIDESAKRDAILALGL